LATYYRLHLRARLPFRLLRTLARFPCPHGDALAAGVWAAADWDTWLPPEASLRVDASGATPALPHSHYSALAVKNALVDHQRQRWGRRSSVDRDDPDLALHLHLHHDRRTGLSEAVLSLDGGGGASLHRRGYRSAVGAAPLKENLAAGLIALTGWDGTVPLVDPMCGSGTLVIEAAAMALGLPAGVVQGEPRGFCLRRWPDFDAALWQRELVAACGPMPRRTLPPLLGLERDPAVLDQAIGNAERAGVAAHIRFERGDARDLSPPPGSGLVVVNPPYGARLGADEDLASLYADLGQVLRQRCGGWTLWLLSGNPELTGALRLKASRRVPVSNGGIDCRWLRYELRAPEPRTAL
ncbi:MAG: class I SAM-dependent RNA methyltransferase, partial [Synechococcaceae cyanobacterium]|nr:class I SAM-dependent RNA methyltransferase [Synechococcaceae cyanobacterium]